MATARPPIHCATLLPRVRVPRERDTSSETADRPRYNARLRVQAASGATRETAAVPITPYINVACTRAVAIATVANTLAPRSEAHSDHVVF